MYAFLLEWLIHVRISPGVYILDGYGKEVFLKLLILIIPLFWEAEGGGPEFIEIFFFKCNIEYLGKRQEINIRRNYIFTIHNTQ